MSRIIAITLLFALAFTLPADITETLRQADSERILALSAAESEGSRNHLSKAIELYETARQNGLANGAFYGNLGTLYLRQGDFSRAILNFRKALIFSPRNQQILSNLELARNMRADHFKEAPHSGVLRTLAAFHYDLGYPVRVNIALCAWILAVLASITLLWKNNLALQVFTILALIFACALGTSAAITSWTLKNNAPAVIIAEQTMPRMGDGDAYSPATTSPIHAGTEITVQRSRGDWSLVTLPGNIHAWLKNSDIEK